MTTIRTSHGTYTGRTAASIIRREYGRGAYYQPSANRSRAERDGGHIVSRPRWAGGQLAVHARVHWIDGDLGH